MPGRKEQRGAEREAAKEDFKICFLGRVICFSGGVSCFGNLLAGSLRLTNRAEEPNKPVRRGRRGAFTGRLKVIKPRKPARKKTERGIRNSFSLKTR